MAGFETIVRPVVFPNIRPAPARSLPPADDPEKGFAIIKGNPAKEVDLNYSYSMSASSRSSNETERRVDVARIYQEEDDGTINRDNYVDIEVANRIKMKGSSRQSGQAGDPVPTDPNAKDRQKSEQWIEHFKKVEEKPNVEIQELNIIQPSQPAAGDGE